MTTPTELLIARHGEAHCNRDQFVGGSAGCRGLTGLGRSQVSRLAERLRREQSREPIHALYTSPLHRAVESSEIVGPVLGLEAVVEPELREQDHGEADGRPWIDVVRAFGAVPCLEQDRPLARGGETWRQYLVRATGALAGIIDRHVGRRVLVVGHGETVVAAFHLLLGLPAESRASAAFAVHAASLTAWRQQPFSWTTPVAGWLWTLLIHNDTNHLHQSGRSPLVSSTGSTKT